MTFDALERSRYLGQPVRLLRLTRGNLVERYAGVDRAVVVDGDTYSPLAMTHSEIQDTSERGKNTITVTLPIDAPCISWWRPFPPSTTVLVELLSVHRGDSEVTTQWIGRVTDRKYTDSQLILRCEQSRTSSRSRGLNLCWMRGCPLAVYSQGNGLCNLNKDDFAVPFTVTSLTGLSLAAAAFSGVDLPLDGGFIEWTRPDGEPESRSIVSQSGGVIDLMYGSDMLPPGTEGIAYPGCPGDWAACTARENTKNYGGAPYLPNKNPYSGNPR